MQKCTRNAQQEKEGVDGRHFLASQHHDGQEHKTNKGQEGGDAVKGHDFTFRKVLIFEKMKKQKQFGIGFLYSFDIGRSMFDVGRSSF